MTRAMNVMAAFLVFISISGAACTQTAKDAWTELVGKRLSTLPAYAFVQNNPALPNVLIYGDSISIDYTLRVRKKLKDKANVYRIHCNGGDAAKVIPAMTTMHEKMGKHWSFKWDIIHFNVGLHDLKYIDKNGNYSISKGKQVHSTEEYKKALKQIIGYFKKSYPTTKIIFATTTPVPENSEGRRAGDAEKYNQAALEVLKGFPQIGINDLYGLTKPNHLKWWKRPGDVHYNKLGANAQGDKVASIIFETLEKNEEAEQGT